MFTPQELLKTVKQNLTALIININIVVSMDTDENDNANNDKKYWYDRKVIINNNVNFDVHVRVSIAW